MGSSPGPGACHCSGSQRPQGCNPLPLQKRAREVPTHRGLPAHTVGLHTPALALAPGQRRACSPDRYESVLGRWAIVTAPKMDSGSTGSSPCCTSSGMRYTGSNSPAGRISSGMGGRGDSRLPCARSALQVYTSQVIVRRSWSWVAALMMMLRTARERGHVQPAFRLHTRTVHHRLACRYML